MDKQLTIRKTADFWIVILTLFLVIFGVMMVFSASYYSSLSKAGDPYFYLKRDGAYALAGILTMLFVSRVNYVSLKRWAIPLIAFSTLLLVMLLIPGVGVNVNGATRWIDIKVFTLMPGEIAKATSILFVAAYYSAEPERIKTAKGILFIMGIGAFQAGLIMLQPNMSTAVTLVVIIGIIMIIAGLSKGWVLGAIATGVAGGLAAIFYEGGYKLERVTSFWNPFNDSSDSGYQVAQGLIAMGSGGLTGRGLGKSLQKNLYLPEPQNDFILAIIGEELGFIGVFVLMVIYMLLIWRCVHISMNSPDRFGTLLGTGITAMLAVQVVLNFGIVTATIPPTGVALPFISYGGNSLLIFCAAMGIMLNIAHHSER